VEVDAEGYIVAYLSFSISQLLERDGGVKERGNERRTEKKGEIG
jgi:hypothetical protein